MKGRKRTPPEINEAKGNPGKRPQNDAAPARVAGEPQMPDTLSPLARKYWAIYCELLAHRGQLSVDSQRALVLICETEAEIEELRADVAANGRFQTVTTKTGSAMQRARPAYSALADAGRRMVALLGEFGLTDASRSRVITGSPNPIVPPTGDNASPSDSDDEFPI